LYSFQGPRPPAIAVSVGGRFDQDVVLSDDGLWSSILGKAIEDDRVVGLEDPMHLSST
jgi:hypothetical protein